MPNMMDYLARRGSSSVSELPWQPLDSLLMANVCYNKLGELATPYHGLTLSRLAPRLDLSPYQHLPFYEERKELLMQMAASTRFGDTIACGYVDVIDHELPVQFSAVTMLVPGAGVVICFRGTDNTLTGWREDLYMSFESPVPGQLMAVDYLTQVAAHFSGPIILTGHSKGGNLAAYAAVYAGEEIQRRILHVDCFDSPGLDRETFRSPGYARVSHTIRSYIPQGSVIGLLLDTEYPLTVVHSTASGLHQHDSFTWQTEDDGFRVLPRNTISSRLTDRTLDTWLQQCTPEQRRRSVNAIFDLLEATNATTLAEMKADLRQSLLRMAMAARDMDSEAVRDILQLAGALVQSGASSAVGMVSDSPFANDLRQLAQAAPEQLRQTTETLRHRLASFSLEKLTDLQDAWRRATGISQDQDKGGIPQ